MKLVTLSLLVEDNSVDSTMEQLVDNNPLAQEAPYIEAGIKEPSRRVMRAYRRSQKER